jgi:hypothetical protein
VPDIDSTSAWPCSPSEVTATSTVTNSANTDEEAQALAEQALACEHQEQGRQAYALRLLGDITVRRDPPGGEPAVAPYQQALMLADDLGMRPLQAHCHRSLGTLYIKTSQNEQPRTAPSTAMELHHTMEMTFWLPETEAARAQVDAR